MIYLILYLLLCVIAGVLGRRSRIGFWGVTLVALFMTPVLTLILVIFFGRRGSYL